MMIIDKNPFVVEKIQEDVLFLVYNDKVHVLTGCAPFIWSKIDTSISYDHLLRKLTSEYDVSEKKADKDLKKIINQFSELEFVSVKGG
ncbi:PqqD family protein [Streptococcus pseudopneumoniae]|uniref:PqqD family protein n=1 Tax=Streptococcus pseudopneumoniae TaxID=257758 RepID=UPI001FB90FF7|nr:PqqD family protein [Streptococcus pseudopneumoniae]